MPHLSAARAPALGSRRSALGRLGRRRPGHHGECPRSGRRWPGAERSGSREAPAEPVREAGCPAGSCRSPPARGCRRRGTGDTSPGLPRPPGAAASFIQPAFAEHLGCARRGARRGGDRGGSVET